MDAFVQVFSNCSAWQDVRSLMLIFLEERGYLDKNASSEEIQAMSADDLQQLWIEAEANHRGGYGDALLYASIGIVFVVCMFMIYAFMRSFFVRNNIRAVTVQLQNKHHGPQKKEKLLYAAYKMDNMDSEWSTYKISFAFLSYYVVQQNRLTRKSKELQILHDVSGYFRPGELSAIMGPSGSGKTTLLNMISGRVYTGKFSGHRILNDRLYKKDDYADFMASQGYVEQVDTFIETMTVRESLLFSGFLRLSDKMSLVKKLERVDLVLNVVDLYDIADAQIGGADSQIKGISGGQKRRLSIATELLRLPSILLLDEPTSGLDAASSLFLIKLLSSLAKDQQMTVITTIHQPRSEIFNLFDHLVLMDKGGFISYCGDSNVVVPYLDQGPTLQVKSSEYDNPGDFIIDAMGLDGHDSSKKKHIPVTAKDEILQVADDLVPHLAKAWLGSKNYEQMMCEVADKELLHVEIGVARPKQSWLHVQTWVCFERRASRIYHSRWKSTRGYIDLLIVSLVITTAFSYEPLKNLMANSDIDAENKFILRTYGSMYQNVMLMFTISAYGMVIQYLQTVPEYFVERRLLHLERRSNLIGYHSYVYSSFLMETPAAVLTSVILMGVSLAVHDWGNLTTRAMITIFMICIIGTSAWQSIICAACASSDYVGPVYSILFLILGSGLLFSGICIAYSDIWPIWYWCYYASAPALTSRSLILASVTSILQDRMAQDSELKLMSHEAMMIVLILTIVVGRLAAISIFYFREQKSDKLVYIEQTWIENQLRQIRNGSVKT